MLADLKTQFRTIIPAFFGDFTTTGYDQSKPLHFNHASQVVESREKMCPRFFHNFVIFKVIEFSAKRWRKFILLEKYFLSHDIFVIQT